MASRSATPGAAAQTTSVERPTEQNLTQPVPPSMTVAWPPVSYWMRAALAVTTIVVLLRALSVLSTVILVILASFVLAIGLQPPLDRLAKRGWSRGWAVAAVLGLFGVPLVVLLGLVVPTVVGQIGELIGQFPEQIETFRTSSSVFAEIDSRIDIEATLNTIAARSQEALPAVLMSGAGFLFNVVTVLVLTPYFAMSLPGLKSWIVRLFERRTRIDILHVLSESSNLVANYIAGNIFISVVAFVVSYIGLSLIGVPFALALAAWIALTDLVPVVGAALGAAVAMIVAGFVGGGEIVATAALLTIYQQVENYVIAPRVMKRAVNVTPPMVIVALMIGGSLAGFVGALLALPVAAMTKVIITEFYLRKRIDDVRASNAADQTDLRQLAHRPELGKRPLPD